MNDGGRRRKRRRKGREVIVSDGGEGEERGEGERGHEDGE